MTKTKIIMTLALLAVGITAALADVQRVMYNLTLRVPSDVRSSLTGTAVVTFEQTERADVTLDFSGTVQGQPLVNGKKRAVTQRGGHITIPAKQLKNGINTVAMNFVSQNSGLRRGKDYLLGLFAAGQAHTCFPCIDQPGEKALFVTKIEAPRGWKSAVSSSTIPITLSQYAFAAGRFEERTTQRGTQTVRLMYRDDDGPLSAQAGQLCGEFSWAIQWMESYTGLRCPFSDVTLVVVPDALKDEPTHGGAVQVVDSRVELGAQPTVEERQRRMEQTGAATARLWYDGVVTLKGFERAGTREVISHFLGLKMARRLTSKSDNPLSQLRANQALVTRDPALAMMQMMEHLMSAKKMQTGLQHFLTNHYQREVTWDDLTAQLEQEAPGSGVRQMSATWMQQKGVPTILTEWRDGQLIVSQQDPTGQGHCWPQKFDVRIINDMSGSRTLEVNMQEPVVAIPMAQAPDYILPNYSGSGVGHFALDKTYSVRAVQRLIVTRNDLHRYALLLTLHDNYLAGRIPPSYFGELYRLLTKERNPIIMETALDHMLRIAADLTPSERQTLELCMTDLLKETPTETGRRLIIDKLREHATSAEARRVLERYR